MSTVRRDFFLDPAERLSEQERALMTGMLAELLGSIADEIRLGLPPAIDAANDADGQILVRQLISAELLNQWSLIALLLRRADEERIGTAVRARSGASSAFLQALIADSNDEISASAMALILARGRRRDRLGQPRLEYDDLPPALAAELAHAVAAALRGRPQAAGGDVDQRYMSAAALLIGRHDAAKRIEFMTAALVRALIQSEKLDEGLIGAAAEEGDVGFLAEALAERAGIDTDAAWDHVLDGGGGRFVMLLRMAGVSRGLAARLLAGVGDLLGISDLAHEIARFDEIDGAGVTAARQWLGLDESYRAALQMLGATDG